MLAHELEEVAKIWPSIVSVFSVPRTEKEYNKLVALLDELINEVGEDENHPLASLMETLGTLIEAYETENYPEPKVSPSETLSFLMKEHDLRQSDLSEIGSEEEISEILSGKRELDIYQIKAISKRFNVSPSVFFED